MVSSSKSVVILIDTTYWGWRFGVVVIKDAHTGKVLWRKFIRKKETLADYMEGIAWLEEHDFKIEGIVCDGLRGILQAMSKYRVQICQFHQVKIIKKYLTSRPELPASRELFAITKFMVHTDKESFEGAFYEWSNRWADFLNERSRDSVTGRSRYVHKRLRSAYLSLKRNMPWLWTWYWKGLVADLRLSNRSNNLP
jgi:hypothetical protein